MPVPVVRRTPRGRGPHLRTPALAIALVAALSAAGCGAPASGEQLPLLPADARPGQPPGSIQMTGGPDAVELLARLQEAITTGGGTVLAVVDHGATATAAGASAEPSTLVIGGTPAAADPLVTADQRAGIDLPQRYLVRQGADGATVTTDGANYVAAVAGILDPAAASTLATETTTVLGGATLDPAVPAPTALVGVSPAGYLVSVFGSADVADTVARLRRNADRGGTSSLAVADLTVAGGRPTSVVLITAPAQEAALLAAAPSIGLDLPLRFLIWVDEQNRTQIAYPDVARMAVRHGLPAEDPAVAALAAEADRLARLAAGTAR